MKDFVVLMDTVGDLSPELLEREEVETEQECKYAYIENDKIVME